VLVLTDGYALVYGGIALVMALTLVVMALARSGHDIIMGSTEGQFRAPADTTTWVMGFVLFLYVGAEFGLGSWVSSYTRETAGAGVMTSALLASGYWGALALGRVAAAICFRWEREATALLLASVAGAGICTLVLSLSSGNLAVAAAAAFGAGLFLGPIWPAVLTIVSATTIGSSTAATVTMGNAGGIAIPWLQGRVLVGAGGAQGVAVTAALCAVMFVVVAVFRQRSDVRV
jgi:FHS family glucose/mannose:H+ symporter-like MFS transporter